MIELLRKVQLFEKLNDEQLHHMLSIARKQTFAPGTVLFQENDQGAAFYILLKGSIKIFTSSSSGDEKFLSLIQAGRQCHHDQSAAQLRRARPNGRRCQTVVSSSAARSGRPQNFNVRPERIQA